VKLPFAGSGAGASPHQGGIVDTQNGDWYYMAFNDSYPAGRIPVMAPITWKDGWPSVTLVNGKWGATYPFPNLPCGADKVKPMLGTDTFSDAALGPEWEWNHNPDNTKWSAGSGLTLQTATQTNDLYAARNTLTHRIPGPTSTATIELDYSAMKDGDVAGLAALRDSSAWIGVKRSAGAYQVATVNNITLDSSWKTSSTGTQVASAPASTACCSLCAATPTPSKSSSSPRPSRSTFLCVWRQRSPASSRALRPAKMQRLPRQRPRESRRSRPSRR
jgi:beta-xylosidase